MRPNKTGADGKPESPATKKDQQLKTQTFIDKGKGIVVRIVKSGRAAKIYVFPVHTIMQSKVTVTLYPSGKKYKIPDIDYPLVVNDLPEVEGVSVEVG